MWSRHQISRRRNPCAQAAAAVVDVLEARKLFADITWSAGSGNWDEPTNWDLNRLPNASDNVIIPAGTQATVRAGAGTIYSIANSGKLSVIDGGSLFISYGGTHNDLDLAGGSLFVGYSGYQKRITGDLTWSSGTLNGQGPLELEGTGLLSGADQKTLGVVLQVEGTVTHAGSSTLYFNDGNADLIIEAGGLYDITGDGDFVAANNAFAPTIIRGTLRKSGAGESTYGGPFNMDFIFEGGTLDVKAGSFVVTRLMGISRGGTINAAAGAVVRFENANNYWGGTFTGTGAGRVELASGALYGFYENGLTLDFAPGLFHFVGGTLVGYNAAQPLLNKGSLQVSGSADKAFASTIFNEGTVTVSGAGQLSVHNSVFENKVGGVLAFADGTSLYSGTINNAGTLRKLAGPGEATLSTSTAVNHTGGRVDVLGGAFATLGSGTSSNARFDVVSGASFRVARNNLLSWTGTFTGSGGGQVIVEAGGVQAGSSGVTLNFPAGMFQWQGGWLGADNVPLRNEGFLYITGAGDRTFRGFIDNAGTVVQDFTGDAGLYGFAIVKNLAGATWEVRNTGRFNFVDIENAGTYRKTGTATNSFNGQFIQLPGGKLQVTGGTLDLARGGRIAPTAFEVTAGATLQFSGGSAHSFIQGADYTLVGTGMVRFSGAIRVFDEANATTGPAFNIPTLTVGAGAGFLGPFLQKGTMTIETDANWGVRAGELKPFRNLGTIVHLGGGYLGLDIIGNFRNDGTYEMRGDGDIQLTNLNIGAIPVGIVNTGVFKKTAGTGLSELRDPNGYAIVTMNNQGTVEVASGTLSLGERVEQLTRDTAAPGTPNTLTGGTWIVRTGATLEMPGGTNIAPGGALPPIAVNRANVTLAGGTFTQFAGVNSNAGTINLSDRFDFTTAGNLSNTGTLRPGKGSALSVNGTLTSTAGTLAFPLGGTSASGDFGKIVSTGVAALGGTAAIEVESGFAPAPGDAYTLMTFPSKTGTFADITGDGPDLTATLNNTAFVLNATGTAGPADLAIDGASITLPTAANVGESLTVGYTVRNLSTSAATGSWTDSIYLSRNNTFEATDALLGRVTRTTGLAGGSSYVQSATFNAPGVPDDNYYVIVITDSGRTVSQTNRANDKATSTARVGTTIPLLTYGQAKNITIKDGESKWFRIARPTDTDAQLSANFTVNGQAELFVSRQVLPTRSAFNATASDLFDLSRTIDLSLMTDFDYYVLVHGREGAGAAGKAMTLQVDSVPILVKTVSAGVVGNSGVGSFVITGLGFTGDSTVELVSPGGSARAARSIFYERTTSLTATFDLGGLAAGNYGLRVTRPDGRSHTLAGAVTVNPSVSAGKAFVNIAAPGDLRQGRGFEFVVEYGNDGGSDIVAPWISIGVTPGISWKYKGGATIDGRHIDILGTSPDGLAGVLRPGQRIRLTFEAVWNSGNAPDFTVWGATAAQRLTPEQMITRYGGTPGENEWVAAATLLDQRFGSTIQSYINELATLASRRSIYGKFTNDVNELINSAVFNALLDTDPDLNPAGVTAQAKGAPRIIGDTGGLSPARTLPTDPAYVKYDTDPSTYGDGDRLPDGRWTPWVPAREATPEEIKRAENEVGQRSAAVLGWFGFRGEWVEWIRLWASGQGGAWTADVNSRMSREVLEYLQSDAVGGQLNQVWDAVNDAIRFQTGPFTDIPQGVSSYRFTPTPNTYYVDMAEKVAPKFGDVKWAFGGSTLAVGRNPAGQDVGFPVTLTRYNLSPAGDVVFWRAHGIPMRIEDNFTIDEHVVNRAAKRGGKDAFKNDLGFYTPFYILETFGEAKAIKWYVNMFLPEKTGKTILAGVDIDRVYDQTVYLPDGQFETPVQLGADVIFVGARQLQGAEGSSYVWSGPTADPADERFPTIALRKGTHVFNLVARGKAVANSPVAGREYRDQDFLRVLVLDESDRPTIKPSVARPRPRVSADPNDITGPAGAGATNFVTTNQVFPYAIRFENLSTANAPAQDVFITQQLDADLDWTTFELGSFGFGGRTYEIPAGRQNYTTRLDLSAELGLLVDVDAGLNPLTGQVHWTFRSIDPATGDITGDALAGFLPPNLTSPEGEGFVRYVVNQKKSLPSGTRIAAQARIVFDTNAPIDTNVYVNDIDALAPSNAKVNALPAKSGKTFAVSWTGTDDAKGSGVASYDVFVSTDGGPFVKLLNDTTQTSTSFTGEEGKTYGFIAVALDNVGQQQTVPTVAQATTTVASTPVPTGVASIRGAVRGVAGQSVPIKVAASLGSSALDAPGFRYVIDWKDGSPVETIARTPRNGPGVNVTHVFPRNGDYEIALSVFDAAGNQIATAKHVVAIRTVALQADLVNAKKTALYIGGTEQRDVITIDWSRNKRAVVKMNGIDRGTYPVSGRIVVYGLGGSDTITINKNVPVQAFVFGDGGNDTLTLASGTSGVLIGGRDDDTLTNASSKRSVLIGGAGKNTLRGGSGEDILIGGVSQYDDTLFSLVGVFDEWSRTNRNYVSRVQRLTGGAKFGLKVAINASTVRNAGSIDALTGNGGNDWYLFGSATDRLTGRTKSETATALPS